MLCFWPWKVKSQAQRRENAEIVFLAVSPLLDRNERQKVREGKEREGKKVREGNERGRESAFRLLTLRTSTTGHIYRRMRPFSL